MPPKPKFTKEEIGRAALALVREKGEKHLTSRDVGAELGCSARPVFTAFESMAELKAYVIKLGMDIYEAYIKNETDSGKYPPYKAMGMAYIRLAREEKNLFRLLFMRDRTGEPIPSDFEDDVLGALKDATTLEGEAATLFQTEMWLFIHGIATMHATSYMNYGEELISRMVTDAFTGLKERHGIK